MDGIVVTPENLNQIKAGGFTGVYWFNTIIVHTLYSS